MDAGYYTVLQTTVLENYHRLNLSNDEMMFLIHVMSFQQVGEKFPPIHLIQKRMGFTNEAIYACLGTLIERQFIEIITSKNQQGQIEEQYSLEPFYTKLKQLDEQVQEKNKRENADKAVAEVFDLIQDEFSRQLSPIEYQTVSEWMSKENYTPELIKEAVKEAVLNQVYNLRYIDKILMTWKRTGKRTTSHSRQVENQAYKLPPVSLEKWIEDE